MRIFDPSAQIKGKKIIVKDIASMTMADLTAMRELYDYTETNIKSAPRQYALPRFTIIVNGKIYCADGEWDAMLMAKLLRKPNKVLRCCALVAAVILTILLFR